MTSSIDVAAWLDEQKISGTQILILVLCTLATVFDGYDAQIVGYVAPAIIQDWHLSPAMMTPVFVAGNFGLFAGSLLFGWVADRIGRKNSLVIATGAFGLLSLLTTQANSVETLLILRFLTAVALGGELPNAVALVAESFPNRRRATAVMIMTCGFALGSTFGSLTTTQLLAPFGWRSLFLVGGLMPLALAPLLAFALPESVRYLVMKKAGALDIAALMRRLHPAAAVPADARFIDSEQQGGRAAIRDLFTNGRTSGTLLLWLMYFASLLTITSLMAWLPTILRGSGFSMQASVVMTGSAQVGGLIAPWVLGPLMDRIGRFTVMLPTALVGIVAIAAIGSVGNAPNLVGVAAFIAGFCLIGGTNAANFLAAVFYPTSVRGTGVGWMNGIGRLAGVVGPTIGGVLLHLQWNRDAILLIAAVPEVLMALAVLAMAWTNGKRLNRAHSAAELAAMR